MKQTPHPIGLVAGSGIGREILDAAELCLRSVTVPGHLNFRRFAHDTEGHGALECLRAFYTEVRAAGGSVLRASVPAPICYQLRREFNLHYKLVAFRSDQVFSTISPLKADRVRETDLLLIRQNNQGVYHGSFSLAGERILAEQVHDVAQIMCLAKIAFAAAAQRRGRLHLLLKTEILGPLGVAWQTVFAECQSRYPQVRFDIAPPDSGSAQLMLAPWAHDVIVTGDVEGDIFSDQLAVLVHGTRAVTPSVNCDGRGFCTYQTIHGTAKGLAGKDLANPAAMIFAAAWLLEKSANLPAEALRLRKATLAVLGEVMDPLSDSAHNADLVLQAYGTKQFAVRVCAYLEKENLRAS